MARGTGSILRNNLSIHFPSSILARTCESFLLKPLRRKSDSIKYDSHLDEQTELCVGTT